MAVQVSIQKVMRKGQHHWIWHSKQEGDSLSLALDYAIDVIVKQISKQICEGYISTGSRLTFKVEVKL